MIITVVSLMLVAFGFGVEPETGSWMEVFTGLSAFFGTLGLIKPSLALGLAFTARKFPATGRVR